MNKENLDWSTNEDFPSVLNPAQNGFSVDVLIYFECLDEHTVGWFEYSTMCWRFLRKQDYSGRKFHWRHFIDEIDKNKFN